MLKAGEVYENPVTGERAVIRIGAETTRGERLWLISTSNPAAR
jgi:hypothetical protein